MPFQHRFWIVLAPFWHADLKIDFPRPSVSASFFTSIFDRFLLPTSTPWISKKYVFPNEKQGFFKKARFEDNIDFGTDVDANLPPCCPPKSKIFRNSGLPRALQNFIFFCIDLLSILATSWPPTWVHLGSQDASKSEKTASNNLCAAPLFWVLMRTCFGRLFKSLLASIFWGSGLDFRLFLDVFWSFVAYFGNVFGCSSLTWFSLLFARSTTNFAKKIQERRLLGRKNRVPRGLQKLIKF